MNIDVNAVIIPLRLWSVERRFALAPQILQQQQQQQQQDGRWLYDKSSPSDDKNPGNKDP